MSAGHHATVICPFWTIDGSGRGQSPRMGEDRPAGPLACYALGSSPPGDTGTESNSRAPKPWVGVTAKRFGPGVAGFAREYARSYRKGKTASMSRLPVLWLD